MVEIGASQVALVVKKLPASAGDIRDAGSIPGSERSGGRNDNPFQYSCLEKPHVQRNLVGYSPLGAKSQTRLKQLSTHTHTVLRCSFSLPNSLPQNNPCHHNLCLTSFPFHCCRSVLHLVSIWRSWFRLFLPFFAFLSQVSSSSSFLSPDTTTSLMLFYFLMTKLFL